MSNTPSPTPSGEREETILVPMRRVTAEHLARTLPNGDIAKAIRAALVSPAPAAPDAPTEYSDVLAMADRAADKRNYADIRRIHFVDGYLVAAGDMTGHPGRYEGSYPLDAPAAGSKVENIFVGGPDPEAYAREHVGEATDEFRLLRLDTAAKVIVRAEEAGDQERVCDVMNGDTPYWKRRSEDGDIVVVLATEYLRLRPVSRQGEASQPPVIEGVPAATDAPRNYSAEYVAKFRAALPTTDAERAGLAFPNDDARALWLELKDLPHPWETADCPICRAMELIREGAQTKPLTEEQIDRMTYAALGATVPFGSCPDPCTHADVEYRKKHGPWMGTCYLDYTQMRAVLKAALSVVVPPASAEVDSFVVPHDDRERALYNEGYADAMRHAAEPTRKAPCNHGGVNTEWCIVHRALWVRNRCDGYWRDSGAVAALTAQQEPEGT